MSYSLLHWRLSLIRMQITGGEKQIPKIRLLHFQDMMIASYPTVHTNARRKWLINKLYLLILSRRKPIKERYNWSPQHVLHPALTRISKYFCRHVVAYFWYTRLPAINTTCTRNRQPYRISTWLWAPIGSIHNVIRMWEPSPSHSNLTAD